jgi:hypothetical protein
MSEPVIVAVRRRVEGGEFGSGFIEQRHPKSCGCIGKAADRFPQGLFSMNQIHLKASSGNWFNPARYGVCIRST